MASNADESVGHSAESSPMEDTSIGNNDKLVEERKSKDIKKKKKKKGLLSRVWDGIFGSHKDDFELRLERLSKEEAAILTRMRQRAQNWGRMKRHFILFSVLLEIFAVGYALITARTAENWKVRALRVLPMFLFPALSFVTYSSLASFIRMCERKDQKTLENLRTERQLKIDELKEKTNYYITQQLIQRYDTDPAAKAAAASVLASKLGAESGLKVFLGDESKPPIPTGKSNDVELQQSSGLRNRKHPVSSATSPSKTRQHSGESTPFTGSEFAEYNQQLVVGQYQPPPGPVAYSNNWLSRIAAMLVGEDPTQCYALICGNCHMHNGLASKEDFPYVTYICPHCHVVNGPKIRQEQHIHETMSPKLTPTLPVDLGNASSIPGDSPCDDAVENNNPEMDSLVTQEVLKMAEVSAAGNEN